MGNQFMGIGTLYQIWERLWILPLMAFESIGTSTHPLYIVVPVVGNQFPVSSLQLEGILGGYPIYRSWTSVSSLGKVMDSLADDL